ncbi:hypothetical protein [Nonomuraea typhae]|uniref:hypothetical protein n=1 Tax=Nonomuraea typhae TaxID=2603600 RepID=UPI0012F94F61|nr:hypothetical protein [Nonomuraea typhae]
MSTRARCDHSSAVPVESALTGETLAALCPTCDTQLPAEFLGCEHANAIDIYTLAGPPGEQICNDCGTYGWYGTATTPTVLPYQAGPDGPGIPPRIAVGAP